VRRDGKNCHINKRKKKNLVKQRPMSLGRFILRLHVEHKLKDNIKGGPNGLKRWSRPIWLIIDIARGCV
jgi:hypothetical protein